MAVLLIAVVSAFAINRGSGAEKEFTPPPIDASAQFGAPSETEKSYQSIEFPVYDDICRVFLDANPQLDGDNLKILLTSPKENKPLISVILYDSEMNIIGKSGIVCPGEYVEAVELAKAPASGENIKVKLLTYEQDTYYSLGSINATIIVR